MIVALVAAAVHAAGSFAEPTNGRVAGEPTSIPLRVDWSDNALDAAPVTFGVPFPRGLLDSADRLHLVSRDGTIVGAQATATATWDGSDGSVRWALITATLERGRDYALVVAGGEGPDGDRGEERRDAGQGVLRLEETEDELVVTTGPMQAVVSKRWATVLDSVAIDVDGDGAFSDEERIVTPTRARANPPAVVDGRGVRYVARGALAESDQFRVDVVRRGPQELVIRREGWYVGPDGTRFAQFITYTYFYAGHSGLRHDHTLVVAFDTTEHQVRDILLSLPLEVGPEAEASFARDESPLGDVLRVAAPDLPARLVQTAHDRWVVTAGGDGGAGILAEGARAGGWFGLEDSRWGAFAGWQDFWQQYPADLEAAGGELRLHLWPAHGTAPLDFRPSALMGSLYPGDRIFYSDFYRGGLDSWTQGFGLGKTHNLWIQFFTAGARTRAAGLTRAFVNEPVLASATPEWNTSTGVLGRVHPEDRERFPELEAVLDAIIHRKRWLQERLGNYGWIGYGDVNYDLTNPLNPYGVTPTLWRRWASMFYGWPNVAPLLYLRSGRRDLWEMHRTNTRHITDVDIAHLESEAYAKRKGGRYGGNGGIVHYAANMYDMGPDSHLRFMLYDYYINGNLRTWEVANEFVEDLAGRVHLPQNRVYTHRGTGGSLRLFAEAYEATWNPRYLEAMRQFAEILYAAQKELGHTRYDDVYMNEGKVKYYELTGDERMRELFLNDMRVLAEARDAHVLADIRHTTMWGLAQAYWLTGDPHFLDFLLWQLALALGPDPSGTRPLVTTKGDPGTTGAVPLSLEHAYHATLGNQLPTVMQLLAELDIPLSYLLSEPRQLLRAEDGAGMVVHAPEGFSPPALQRPVRVYFLLPRESEWPGIHFDAPVRLYDPGGRAFADGRGLSGWVNLHGEEAGLWSFEPVDPVGRLRVETRNLPPFFALDAAEMYFLPDIPWIEWESPRAGRVVQGEIPVAFRLRGGQAGEPGAGGRVRFYVDGEFVGGRLMEEGVHPAGEFTLDTFALEDGVHRLQVEVEWDGRTIRSAAEIEVDNWWTFRDPLRAPIAGNSFFGEVLIDLSLTSAKSPGWRYATDAPADFANDVSRMVPQPGGAEYLIWDLPEPGLVAYRAAVFARAGETGEAERVAETVRESIEIALLPEGETEWRNLPYAVAAVGLSAGGWWELNLAGEIEPFNASGRIRVLVDTGKLSGTSLQLGEFVLSGHPYGVAARDD